MTVYERPMGAWRGLREHNPVDVDTHQAVVQGMFHARFAA
jgi:hypothetical protein